MKNVIMSTGELLVEIMRTALDQPLDRPAGFTGPYASGAPAIFIDSAARMGAQTRFIGVIGPDDFGRCVIGRLAADGVDTALIRIDPARITGIAFVSYLTGGARKFIFHLPQAAAATLCPDDLPAGCLEDVAYLHVAGSSLSISESAREACYAAVRRVKKAGGKVSFDPNLRPELLGMERVREIVQPVLDATDVLLPSGEEARLLTGDADDDRACQTLLARGIPLVALKQGARGCTLYSASGAQHIEAISVTEVDPTGAGDTFGGALVTALLEGWELPRAARFANVAGALSVTQQGPMEGIPTRAQVLARMEQ